MDSNNIQAVVFKQYSTGTK